MDFLGRVFSARRQRVLLETPPPWHATILSSSYAVNKKHFWTRGLNVWKVQMHQLFQRHWISFLPPQIACLSSVARWDATVKRWQINDIMHRLWLSLKERTPMRRAPRGGDLAALQQLRGESPILSIFKKRLILGVIWQPLFPKIQVHVICMQISRWARYQCQVAFFFSIHHVVSIIRVRVQKTCELRNMFVFFCFIFLYCVF